MQCHRQQCIFTEKYRPKFMLLKRILYSWLQITFCRTHKPTPDYQDINGLHFQSFGLIARIFEVPFPGLEI